MDIRILVDSTLRCMTNFYKDGDDCKGIVYFLSKSHRYMYKKRQHVNFYPQEAIYQLNETLIIFTRLISDFYP